MCQSLRPRSLSERQLSKVGVEIVDKYKLLLGCCACGETWAVSVLPGGHLPRGYWECPYGCNKPEPRTVK